MKNPVNFVKRHKVPSIIGVIILVIGCLYLVLHYDYWHGALFTATSDSKAVYQSKLLDMPNNWAVGWSYNCSNVGQGKGGFAIIVSDSNGNPSTTDGPVNENNKSGMGVTIMPAGGNYTVKVGSAAGCTWAARAKRSSTVTGYDNETTYPTSTAAAATPKTLLDVSGSGSQQTQAFTADSKWTVTYTFDCTSSGDQGNFQFYVENTDGSSANDVGANELSSKGGATDYYYDSGEHYLTVNSECDWHVVVKG